ncbi:MAG TPA: porin [Gemmatimonadales bacterium]|jgi:hypothetical protein|nr:porin [Gemmatimonadales bacterium]
MRRMLACLLLVLVAGGGSAHAQVRLATPDGWTFTFAGNVGAFYVFEHESDAGEVTAPAALVRTGHEGSAVRSGYLPAFAVFDAKGTEGSAELTAHFGLAPVVQTTGGHDDDDGLGARIDLRQAYVSVAGHWGRLLAGREVGVFGRQSMLTDMSLFGTGATGGISGNPGGTTLGHSGYGYIYPGFNAQIAYSTPAGRALQFTVALFDPSTNNNFDQLISPRLESELQWERGGLSLWLSGLLQPEHDTQLDAGATAWGASAGGRAHVEAFTVSAHGYTGRGIGGTLLFRDGRTADAASTALRPSEGFYSQLTFEPHQGALTLGLALGASRVRAARDEPYFRTTNRAATLGAYYQATRSLKVVGEVTEAWTLDDDAVTHDNRATTVAAGMMLFF